ncbi:integral inner nuclear membrane protein Ima1 [Sarocladium implicatum]|nr:integral inner nuclear membrane protein Ima1 [Sarocladium implicatum]
MARLRKPKVLTCFYCGKRSSIPNDGTHSNFLCLYCDATNYIDEDGEITDPPVATEREVPAPRYVQNQKAASPPQSPGDSIFCATCLKNQRLYTASLAQYLPDDPTDTRDEPLDKRYYKFRRDLEERYPQVCADCEGRVLGRIKAAGYTARTDHMRRLMASSKARRPGKKLTSLDMAERLGRCVWWAGLVLQMLWHFKMVAGIFESSFEESVGMIDPDEPMDNHKLQRRFVELSRYLPSAGALIRGSITAAVLSIWWNPRFVQVTRGFSRHLLGFRQWYCFQGLIVFFRVMAERIGSLDAGSEKSVPSPIMPHVMMASLMLLIAVFARKSIRVDTQALFGFAQTAPSPSRNSRKVSSKAGQRQGVSGPADRVIEYRARAPPPSHSDVELKRLPTPQVPAIPFGSSRETRQEPSIYQPFGAPESPTLAANEPDEMDWTPTQSQHRAFSNMPTAGSPSRPFSQAPVQPESGPFWYKVPPAPMNPAQKLRNPSKVPLVRPQATEAKSSAFSFSSFGVDQQDRNAAKASSVEFRQPTFFAPVKDDERSSLADMLDKSFSLGTEQVEETPIDEKLSKTGEVKDAHPRIVSPYAAIVAGILLLAWTLISVSEDSVEIPYLKEVDLCIAALAGIVALACMGQPLDSAYDAPGIQGLWARLSPVVEVAELALVCYLGFHAFTGKEDYRLLGYGTLGFGFAKHTTLAVSSHQRRRVA